MNGKEPVRLTSIFGGDPEEPGMSGKTRRREWSEFMGGLPLLLPSSSLLQLPQEQSVPLLKSPEGLAYAKAETEYARQLGRLVNIVRGGDAGLAQQAFNVHMCEKARKALIKAASAPAIQIAFQTVIDKQGAELKAHETPLPRPPWNP